MTESPDRRGRARGVIHRVRWWLLTTLLLWASVAGLTLRSAYKSALAGELALRSVSAIDDPTDVDLDVVQIAMAIGERELVDADTKLNSLVLYPLRPLPFVGRQFASTRALVRVARDVTQVLRPLVDEVQEVRSGSSQIDRVVFLESMSFQLGQLESVASTADLGPGSDLLPQLAEGRAELASQLDELATKSDQYRLVTGGLASFLGQGDYLLLGSNNAEMRIGSGMHLSVGRLETANGQFSLVGLTPSDDLAPISGASVLDSDVADRWGFIDLATDFRRLGYSARFDEHVAPQALELWRAETGEMLDGVILVDPFVLEALIGVLGQVEVEGEVYDESNLLSYLLHDQYEALGEEYVQEDNEVRRDRLALLAGAVSQSFGENSWDPIELIRALQPVARGRHIMVYSRDVDEQAAWEAMGVDGAIDGSETGVFWLNTGASKLDPFLDISVAVTTTIEGDQRRVHFQVTTVNNASSDLSRYALGPWASIGVRAPGAYRGRFAFYAPAGATDAVFTPERPLDALGPDGPLWLVASKQITIFPGVTSVIEFEYLVAANRVSIDVLPSGRFPQVQWNWDGESFDDAERRTVQLDG